MSYPCCQDGLMKNTNRTVTKPQLALTLPEGCTAAARRSRKPCSRERAAWWFRQMHRVIEEGNEFQAPGVF